MAAISLFGDTNIAVVTSVTHHSLRLFPVCSAHDPSSLFCEVRNTKVCGDSNNNIWHLHSLSVDESQSYV